MSASQVAFPNIKIIFDSNQEIVGTIGLHYDITSRKKSMSELKWAKSQAEAAKEAEKQFLANVSHEMRTQCTKSRNAATMH